MIHRPPTWITQKSISKFLPSVSKIKTLIKPENFNNNFNKNGNLYNYTNNRDFSCQFQRK